LGGFEESRNVVKEKDMIHTDTNSLVQALCIAVERRVRAEDILKLETSGKNASAVKARQREERNCLRALNTHLKDCLKVVRSNAKRKTPAPIKPHLRGRTINALRNWDITQPEELSIKELLKIPSVGVLGVAAIAQRCYPTGGSTWPELEK
jgi:hypothetical protein